MTSFPIANFGIWSRAPGAVPRIAMVHTQVDHWPGRATTSAAPVRAPSTMTKPVYRNNPREESMVRRVCWFLAGALCILCASAASAASIAELRAAIDGVYTLEEWHIDGQVLRPPQVDGRFVLMHGTVMTVLLNDAQELNRTSNALFGTYVLDETSFSYGYDTRSGFTQTPSTTTVSRTPGFAGMRRFVVSISRERRAPQIRPAGVYLHARWFEIFREWKVGTSLAPRESELTSTRTSAAHFRKRCRPLPSPRTPIPRSGLVVLSHFAIPAAGCKSAMRLIRSAGGFDGLAAIG